MKFSIWDEGSMCPRRAGARHESQETWASSSIPWQDYWVWQGKIKVYWFFGPVKDLGGGQMAIRKMQQTEKERAVIYTRARAAHHQSLRATRCCKTANCDVYDPHCALPLTYYGPSISFLTPSLVLGAPCTSSGLSLVA